MQRIKWTDQMIARGILESIDILRIDRMPTSEELRAIGRNDLQCKISRTKKFTGWAKELNLKLKSCETRLGNEYEGIIAEILTGLGYEVKQMTTKHPYDLLVNNTLKIDVKVTKAHTHFGSRAHTFHLSKRYATCDLYVCVALDENDSVERYFIIPAKFAQLQTINVGTDSKYNKFINRWHYVKDFVEAFNKVVIDEGEAV